MVIPLRDPANTSPAPSARATSPTPSSISAATSPVLSINSTAVVGSPAPAKCLRLDTLFNTRRGYHIPLVSLTERKDDTQQHDVPPAPAPVSLGPADWKSWLGGLVGSASVTGDQIDALCTWVVLVIVTSIQYLFFPWKNLVLMLVLFGFQWPALIGLSRRNLNHVLHRGVIPSGKQDRARRGRQPHLLLAQIAIYTINCTPLLRNAGGWLAPPYSFTHANHRDALALAAAVKCLAAWKRASTL